MSRIDKLFTKENMDLLHELFIKPCDAFKLPNSLEKDAEMLRLAIIAELDAANLYKRMADESSIPEIAKVFRSVADEEIVHVGEFDYLLEKIDPTHDKNEDKGEDEAEELTGWEEDEEEDPAESVAPSESVQMTEDEIKEAFARLVQATVVKGRRVPVRGVARRVSRRAGKRYVRHKVKENQPKPKKRKRKKK